MYCMKYILINAITKNKKIMNKNNNNRNNNNNNNKQKQKQPQQQQTAGIMVPSGPWEGQQCWLETPKGLQSK